MPTRHAVPNVSPFTDLADAARATMLYLRDELHLGHWMFTRKQNDDWVILDTVGHEYPIEAGDVLVWSDSFCSRMVVGEGPMIAPRAVDVPAYAAAPVARVHHIESYVGMPILRGDGSLFGTMCAIDAKPAGDIERYQPLVELFARISASQSIANTKPTKPLAARTMPLAMRSRTV